MDDLNELLQVAGILDNSVVNGEGMRTVVFLSGCSHNCTGCHNSDMQDYNYGQKLSVKEIIQRIKENIPIIRGVTFSGGEPFDQADTLLILAREIRSLKLNIWCYSGYTYEELSNSLDQGKRHLLENIDVLVDGKFEENLKSGALRYTGSSNQRIISINK